MDDNGCQREDQVIPAKSMLFIQSSIIGIATQYILHFKDGDCENYCQMFCPDGDSPCPAHRDPETGCPYGQDTCPMGEFYIDI